MMNFRETAFQIGYSLFTEGVKNFLSPKSKPSNSVPDSEQVHECKGCTIHTEVGQAYLYMLGISKRVDDEAEIPKGIAGTILLARAHVQKAYVEATGLMFIDPKIDDHATKLVTVLPEIDARLEHVANGREAKQITLMCKDAWETAYCIPEIMFQPREPKPEVVQLREEVDKIKQQIDDKISEEATHAKPAGVGGTTGTNNTPEETS